jgi:hypothetical protein
MAARNDDADICARISQFFEGNDGPWYGVFVALDDCFANGFIRSTFQLTAGTGHRGQSVRLLPSTSLSETYLIVPKGCDNDVTRGKTFVNNASCDQSRGGLFNANESLNYIPQSIYNPGQYRTFALYGKDDFNAELGFDELRMGLPSEDKVGIKQMNVFGYTDFYFSWTGLLGIDPRPSFFTGTRGFSSPQPNFLQQLFDKGQVPSLSWAYTAGSKWRKFSRFFTTTAHHVLTSCRGSRGLWKSCSGRLRRTPD